MKRASIGMVTILGICLAVVLAACGGDDGDTARSPTAAATASATATASPTATATSTPTASPTSTPTPLPEVPNLTVPGWEDAEIRTVCLEVTQTYPQISGDLDEPIEGIAKRLLQALNISAVVDGDTCEATLGLSLSGTALGATYQEQGLLYTGAEYSGTISLKATGRPETAHTVEARLEPPDFAWFPAGNPPTTPEQAPFDEVWGKLVFSSLAYLWGTEVYVAAFSQFTEAALVQQAVEAVEGELQSGTLAANEADAIVGGLGFALTRSTKDSTLGLASARLLGALAKSDLLSPDAKAMSIDHLSFLLAEWVGTAELGAVSKLLGELGQAGQIGDAQLGAIVPTLIDLLGHEFEPLGQDAAIALERITGNSFGVDPERWRQWWASQ